MTTKMQLPEDFETYTRTLMGEKLYGTLRGALNADAPTSIRLNPLKAALHDVNEAVHAGIVPWCQATGRYLRERPNFTFDPLMHAGVYYVQEASSMFVDFVVRQLIHHPVTMLDMCAAPGGKSTAVRAALPEGSLLFSNEPVRTRAQILAENIQKFGHPDVIVTNNYPRDYRKSGLEFDVILTDVPCSGEGMFRKDDGARAEWSMQNVDNCQRLQREIVADAWQCLKPGGLLIYSTCTFNAKENEENVEWAVQELGAQCVALPTDKAWNITGALTGNAPVCRFLPGISRGEGLFMAVLSKPGEALPPTHCKKKKQATRRNDTAKGKALPMPKGLIDADNFALRMRGDTVSAIPKRWADIYDAADGALHIMNAGVTTAHMKGKDLIPAQGLALSACLDNNAFATVDINLTEAIAYLRKEPVVLPADTPRGFVLLRYAGTPLGFEKNIGNRANNLYPQEWKIKTTHLQESPDIIAG